MGRPAGVVLALALAVLSAACTAGGEGGGGARAGSGSGSGSKSGTSATAGPGGDAGRERPRGGVVRVAVWGEPDPAAPTLAGAGVRALVLPQLFVAGPDGRWAASLASPGSDRTAADARSATVALRRGAAWSDGTPITAEDLRRTADARFVAGVDGPAGDGRLTLRFTQRLPGWRRLWSGTDSVAAPRAGVWGGPFVVARHTPGLEVVLGRNDRWYGGAKALLDEVHLVLVPDAVIARQLLAKGAIDVVMPPAATVRTRQLQSLSDVDVSTAERSGWWVGLVLRAGGLPRERRQAVVAMVDRKAFVQTLLQREATVLDGFVPAKDRTWSGVMPAAGAAAGGAAGAGDRGSNGAAAIAGEAVDLVGQFEEPMTPLLQRSMQKRARGFNGRLELRNAEADRVERWLAEGSYQAAIVMQVDGPVLCWVCRWGSVDEGLARAADAGDASAATAMEAKLRDEALLLPLWRSRVVVAWREGIGGIRPNGYALNAAWNAAQWWRPTAVQ